ncbi:hypothetical protein Neosp_004432 [[Neocosmospora] mangrovei]|uniref:Cell wall protein PhiA n=1 Tax=Fusarium vanettenii (strain ATCC MYA-4622 / CBS 123669 / FGSC 9596 / NRRL 45880 / 77-13-4) TaxID=660122 RepID=C7YSN9_FUSV7|nr:uncharacterized protein NECHADRAFT_123164 [Fusarium vanettenii 77-13-4]EEU45673.1 hypothetical protein NECHADRAFT_123164 [Fusarium vanettenii 77-13-4]
MQIKAILLTPLLAAGIVSAAPSKPVQFEAMALRSASPIHFSAIQASKSFLSLNLAKQGASCDKKSDNHAVFNLVGDELYLYKTDNPPQQLYVDRSGMGQGVLGYTTGAQGIPSKAERKGWKIDKSGNLNFNGAGFIACPNSKKAGGSWSVWVDAGNANPGGNKGCLGFTARTIKTTTPNSCEYTQQQ